MIRSLIILITFLLFACSDQNQKEKDLALLLHNNLAKRWERIAFNESAFGKEASDFIIFRDNHKYLRYIYYNDGTFKQENLGDIVIPDYYKLISDTLLYIGNNYFEIEKLTNDTLIISGFCKPSRSVYVKSDKPIPK